MGSYNQRVAANSDSAWSLTGSSGLTVGAFGAEAKGNAYRIWGRWAPNIAAGSTITSATVYCTERVGCADVFYTQVHVVTQSAYNCAAFNVSNPHAWTVGVSPVRWPAAGNLPTWNINTEYGSPDIATLVQEWVDNVADPTTAYIGLRIYEGDAAASEERSPYLRQDDAAKCLRLEIAWTEPGGAAVQVKRRLLVGVGLMFKGKVLRKKSPLVRPSRFPSTLHHVTSLEAGRLKTYLNQKR